MNRKAVKWLYQELPELVSGGILTQEAAGKIRQHYGEIKSASRTPVLLIISGTIGSLLIGLGIILLLAHNWEQFSRFTRVVLSFAPLVLAQAFALWVLLKKPQSSAFKEGSASFLSLMVGASIALISQTYNIPGDTGTFILTWMLLIAPVIYIMQASLPAAIYLIGVTSWAGSYWNDPGKAVLFWPLAAVAVPHFIWALRREIYTIRATLLSLVMLICVSVGAGFSLGKVLPGSWIIVFSSLYAIYYSVGYLKLGGFTTLWQRPLRLIGGVGLFIMALQLTFRDVWRFLVPNHAWMHGLSGIRALPDSIITLALITTALLLCYDNLKRKNLTRALFGALPLLAAAGFFSKDQTLLLPLLIFNIYLFAVSVSHIMLGIRSNSLLTVNTGLLMFSIFVIARFFDSEIGFVVKGLAFIVLGIGCLLVNVVLIRRKRGAE